MKTSFGIWVNLLVTNNYNLSIMNYQWQEALPTQSNILDGSKQCSIFRLLQAGIALLLQCKTYGGIMLKNCCRNQVSQDYEHALHSWILSNFLQEPMLWGCCTVNIRFEILQTYNLLAEALKVFWSALWELLGFLSLVLGNQADTMIQWKLLEYFISI